MTCVTWCPVQADHHPRGAICEGRSPQPGPAHLPSWQVETSRQLEAASSRWAFYLTMYLPEYLSSGRTGGTLLSILLPGQPGCHRFKSLTFNLCWSVSNQSHLMSTPFYRLAFLHKPTLVHTKLAGFYVRFKLDLTSLGVLVLPPWKKPNLIRTVFEILQ